MSETSPMFLTLTPSMVQTNREKSEPASVDHVTLNLAVESLSYHFLSGDKLGPLASTVQVTSVNGGSPVSQDDCTPPAEQPMVEPPHAGDKPIDIVREPAAETPIEDPVLPPATEAPIDDPVLPPAQNDKQDTPADNQDKLVEQPATIVPTLPTQFLTPATVLKHRLQNTKDLIVCPGVYDGFSARIALSVGFDALYMVIGITPRYLLKAY